MLALSVGNEHLRFNEVAPFLLQQARERKGQWDITVFGSRGDSYTVRYTEEEYSKISRTIYHGLRNGTKTSAFHAGLENAAQTLWPTGSLDHVAMRHVGIATVMRYITKLKGESRLPRFVSRPLDRVLACFGISRKMPKLTRVDSRVVAATAGDDPPPPSTTLTNGSGAPSTTLANGGPSSSSSGGPPKTTPPSTTLANGKGKSDDKGNAGQKASPKPEGEPRALSPSAPPVMDAPSLPDDAANSAGASEDGRTLLVGDVVAVLGQNFDKSEPVNHLPVVGLMVGPCQVKPNVYSKTVSNLESAIRERIEKKARKPNISQAAKERIGKFVRTAMSGHRTRGVFSKINIERWAVEHFDLETCRSGKWTTARFRASLDNLYAKERPTFNLKADVKLECMPEGKAPRMLIADGDDGQLMALAVVKCFEDLLFDHFESKSIKHLPKREALDRVVGQLMKSGAKAVEGDGSAWDTTCNDVIRDLVENPILRHIFEVLTDFGVIPESWMEEHCKACEEKKLRLWFSNKFQSMRVKIDAIRRSGHRGTSCLNWWINFTMWVCAVFREPERFLDPDIRTGVDVTGVKRWWNGAFEGDDSLCTMKPPMLEGDPLSRLFLEFWEAAGFNMKIVFCSNRATFVGWHIGCTNGEINKFRSPELPRALANSGVSVSTQAISAAKSGNRRVANVLAAASALARASDFSGILPSVSNKYLEFAESVASSNFQDREMSIRAFGDDGYGAKEVREQVRSRNVGVSPEEELATMKALGYDATFDQIATFSEYVWSMDPQVLMDYGSFRESLPPAWRV